MAEIVARKGERVSIGGLEFMIDYRKVEDSKTIGSDEGVTIRVYGRVEGKSTELLKFDCFNQVPHYHYAPEGKDRIYHIDSLLVGDPIAFVLRSIGEKLPDMIARAGYEELADQVDRTMVAVNLPKIEAAMRKAKEEAGVATAAKK
jgi:hypothetical protein